MTATRPYSKVKNVPKSNRFLNAIDVVAALTAFGIVVGCVYLIVWGVMGNQRGIYAGYHYKDAKRQVAYVLRNHFRLYDLKRWTYRGEEKTHTKIWDFPGHVSDGNQIRRFRFITNTGEHLCVSLWVNRDARGTNIERNCEFK